MVVTFPDHGTSAASLRPRSEAARLRWRLACLVAAFACALVVASPAAARKRPKPAPPTPAQQLDRTARARAAVATGPVPARGPVLWGTPYSIDNTAIDGLSCPTVSLCVAVDDAGRVASSAHPFAPRRWPLVDADASRALTGISCPTVSLCVAVDGYGNVVLSGTPNGPAAGWGVGHVDSSITEPSPDGNGPDLLRGISCPTATMCVAVDAVGNEVYSGDPTGGPGAWGTVHIDNNSDYGCAGGGTTCQAPLMGISCPTVALCAAVDFTGNVLHTTSALTAPSWVNQAAPGSAPHSLWSISCTVSSLCAAVDGAGGNVITWPAASFRLARHALPVDAYGIWCSGPNLCLASGETSGGTATLIGSSNPSGRSPRWQTTAYGAINTISCPTKSLCVAADGQGQVLPGVTVSSLKANLRTAVGARIPRIPLLVRKDGYTLRVTSPFGGMLSVSWQIGPSSHPTVLATASSRYTMPRTHAVKLRLTGAGRATLRGKKRYRLTAVATFNSTTGAVTASRKLSLSSRR